MRLTIIGCSGSFPGPDSPASCYLVTAEHEGRTWRLVLDLGNGALGGLQRHIALADLDAVLLSHLHPDHCLDVTGLYVARTYDPAGPPGERLAIHGPSGTAERLTAAYEGMDEGGMEQVLDFRRLSASAPTHIGPFVVRSFPVNHPVEAYGFRVEADGVVLAYSGDTDSCDALGPLLTGADLALVDSAFVEGRDDARGIHMTGRRAAQAAVDAGGVGRLMLTHIPAWNDPQVCRADAAAVWPGEVELAVPDTAYEI